MDGPEKTQDVATSGDTKGTSEQTQTFTKEDVQKARNDALADVGRYKAESAKAIKAAKAAEERINRMIKDQEEDALEAVRDEPDKVKELRARQKNRATVDKLAAVELELVDKTEEIKQRDDVIAESTKERNAREVATRLNVNPKLLAKLAKATDGSIEAIEAEAQDLPQLGEKKDALVTDSGKTIGGGGGIPTDINIFKAWLESLPQAEYERLAPEINKMRREGKIK